MIVPVQRSVSERQKSFAWTRAGAILVRFLRRAYPRQLAFGTLYVNAGMSECAASRHQNNRAFIRGLDILNGVDCSAQIPALVTVKDHAHQTPPPKINATASFLTLLTQVTSFPLVHKKNIESEALSHSRRPAPAGDKRDNQKDDRNNKKQ